MRKTIITGVIAFAASVPLLAGGAAQASTAAPMLNNPECVAYAKALKAHDPKHNYVCTNKLNNVTLRTCEEGVAYWRRHGAIKSWCAHNPWPMYDLDIVVKTR